MRSDFAIQELRRRKPPTAAANPGEHHPRPSGGRHAPHGVSFSARVTGAMWEKDYNCDYAILRRMSPLQQLVEIPRHSSLSNRTT